MAISTQNRLANKLAAGSTQSDELVRSLLESARPQPTSKFTNYLVGWVGVPPIAIVNNLIHGITARPLISALVANPVSAVTGGALLAGYTWGLSRYFPIQSAQEAVNIGLSWVAFTVAFELVIGYFGMGMPLWYILYDYNLLSGQLGLLVMAWIGALPYIMYRLQPKEEQPSAAAAVAAATVAAMPEAPAQPTPSTNEVAVEPENAPNHPIAIVSIDKSTEVVVLSNVSDQPVDVTGWRLVSRTGNDEHPGIEGTIEPGATREFPNGGRKIWNNMVRDDGVLYDRDGNPISYWRDPA